MRVCLLRSDDDSEDGDLVMDQELEWACISGDFEGIWRAYKDGAKLDIAGEGETPLMAAVDGGQLGVVRLLLGHGVKVDREDGNGCTALTRAVSGGHLEIVQVSRGISLGAWYRCELHRQSRVDTSHSRS